MKKVKLPLCCCEKSLVNPCPYGRMFYLTGKNQQTKNYYLCTREECAHRELNKFLKTHIKHKKERKW